MIVTEELSVVHAFADHRFDGNPAGVRFVDAFAPTEELLAFAADTSLPLTVFVKPLRDGELFEIRWFTRNAELDLCGHGTLAASHWLFSTDAASGDVIEYASRSGPLAVRRDGPRLAMKFPRIDSRPVDAETHAQIETALKVPLVECRRGPQDLLAITGDEQIVVDFEPDIDSIRELECRGIALSASVDPAGPNAEFDIVSRFFAPRIAIDEDQVCGSVHCSLYPYWAARLEKTTIRAWMASASGGRLDLDADGDYVVIAGTAEVRRGSAVGDGTGVLPLTPPEACGPGVVMSEVLASELGNRPFSIASFSVEARAASEPHEHDVAEIWYIASGSGQVVAEERRFAVEQGDFVFLHPKSRHQIRNTGGEPIQAVSVWWEP